jgi:hypothetical protein
MRLTRRRCLQWEPLPAGSSRPTPGCTGAFFFLFFLANACSFFYTTRQGKFLEWDRILKSLRLRTAHHFRSRDGVEIWNTKDQSGNASPSKRATCGRFFFQMPLSIWWCPPSRSVISSRMPIAILKPGGRIVITDIRATALYEAALRALGASHVERRRRGWTFWWGNPLARTTLLISPKPCEC